MPSSETHSKYAPLNKYHKYNNAQNGIHYITVTIIIIYIGINFTDSFAFNMHNIKFSFMRAAINSSFQSPVFSFSIC